MGLFSRLFSRKPPVIDMRNMNEDWRVGDLAVCLTSVWELSPHPVEGDILRVSEVVEGPITVGSNIGAIVYALRFHEMPKGWGYNCTWFRKPIEDAEPAEAEFTALIKRPVRKPAKVALINTAGKARGSQHGGGR